MTRFVFFSDTHIGADPMGWQQQKGYPKQIEKLLEALLCWLQNNGEPVDFLVHGGDLTNTGSATEIQAAAKLLRLLKFPSLVCLGNHDLCQASAVPLWLQNGADFFPTQHPVYYSVFPDCVVHVVPNHWEERPYYWETEQTPQFSPEQEDILKKNLSIRPDLIHILVVHSPVLGIPPEQTGFQQPFHMPNPSFTETVMDWVKQNPHLRLVLAGHNHVNTHLLVNGTHFVTASSFVETPFEFKFFTIDAERIEMRTVTLQHLLDFTGEYDFSKTYVQGRACDRNA